MVRQMADIKKEQDQNKKRALPELETPKPVTRSSPKKVLYGDNKLDLDSFKFTKKPLTSANNSN